MAPSEDQETRIRPRWAFLSIGAIVATALVFNRMPQSVGIYNLAARGLRFTPLLTPEFQMYLPWLNLLWLMALMLEFARLIRRRWTPGIQTADLGLRLCGAALGFTMALDAARIVVPAAAGDAQTLLVLLGIALLVEPLKHVILDGGRIVQVPDHPVERAR